MARLVYVLVWLCACSETAGATHHRRSPLISRHKPTASNVGQAWQHVAVVNGVYGDLAWNGGQPSASGPAWVAINVGRGPSSVLVSWNSGGNYNYTDTLWGAPLAYRIETSADSHDGADGTWTTAVSVDNNKARTREHVVDFSQQRWLRLAVLTAAADTTYGVALDEVDVFDVSNGATDTWFFMGDSISAIAFDRHPERQPSFAERTHARHRTRYPTMIDGGIGGETTWDALRRIDALLAENPDMRFWALSYGSNDASRNTSDPSAFHDNMQTLIDTVRAAGRTPVLPRIPYSADGGHAYIEAFNAVIDELTRVNSLPRGPDLYSYFEAHPEDLADGLHPTPTGAQAINRLWAAAMDGAEPGGT